MDRSAVEPSTSARRMSIAGIVAGVLAIFVLPFILGPVGALLSFTAQSRGDKPLGLYVGIGSIVATILGLILAVVVFQATN